MIRRVILLCLLLGVIALDSRIADDVRRMAIRSDYSVWEQLLGQARVAAAGMLWLKVDQYHHDFEERGLDPATNKDLLGMTRLITRLDPQYEQAYLVGAWVYRVGYGQLDAAEGYLREGLHALPGSWRLMYEMALLQATHRHRYDAAWRWTQRALAHCPPGFDHDLLARLERSLRERQTEDSSPRTHGGN